MQQADLLVQYTAVFTADIAEQFLFDLQVLDHPFHDPITIRQLVEIVLKVADADQIGIL